MAGERNSRRDSVKKKNIEFKKEIARHKHNLFHGRNWFAQLSQARHMIVKRRINYRH